MEKSMRGDLTLRLKGVYMKLFVLIISNLQHLASSRYIGLGQTSGVISNFSVNRAFIPVSTCHDHQQQDNGSSDDEHGDLPKEGNGGNELVEEDT